LIPQSSIFAKRIYIRRVWYPSIQFTCKIYNPTTKETIWKSINVTNFISAPPGLDKRSCKSDQFSITHKSALGTDHPESYTIRANLADDLQLSLDIVRPAGIPGYKIGKGPRGGFSYFGPDVEKPEGYAIHRFWPHDVATGHIISKGRALTAKGVWGCLCYSNGIYNDRCVWKERRWLWWC